MTDIIETKQMRRVQSSAGYVGVQDAGCSGAHLLRLAQYAVLGAAMEDGMLSCSTEPLTGAKSRSHMCSPLSAEIRVRSWQSGVPSSLALGVFSRIVSAASRLVCSACIKKRIK